jgi:hypothetical protein
VASVEKYWEKYKQEVERLFGYPTDLLESAWRDRASSWAQAEERLGRQLPELLGRFLLATWDDLGGIHGGLFIPSEPQELEIINGALPFYEQWRATLIFGIQEAHLHEKNPPVVSGDYVTNEYGSLRDPIEINWYTQCFQRLSNWMLGTLYFNAASGGMNYCAEDSDAPAHLRRRIGQRWPLVYRRNRAFSFSIYSENGQCLWVAPLATPGRMEIRAGARTKKDCEEIEAVIGKMQWEGID